MNREKEQQFGVVMAAVSGGLGLGTGQPEVAVAGAGLGVGWFLAASRGDDVDESTAAVWEHGETQMPGSSLRCRLLGHSPDPHGTIQFDGSPHPSARCSRCDEFRVLTEDTEA